MEIKNYIHIDFTRGKDIVVPSIQYDSGTRWVMAKLYDNGLPIDLQELKVCIVAVKPDGKEIFNECKIIDAEKGIIEFEINKQMGILVGEVECQIKLFGPDQLLSSNIFKLAVTKTLSPSSESSKDELEVLVNALGQVQNIDNRFNEINAQLSDLDNSKAEVAYVDNKIATVANATPDRTLASVDELNREYPNGHNFNKVVASDGHIYTWDSSLNQWKDTGIQYQSTGIANKSITQLHLSDYSSRAFKYEESIFGYGFSEILNLNFSIGALDSDGTIANNQWNIVSDFFTVNDVITIKPLVKGASFKIARYDSEKRFMNLEGSFTTECEFENDANYYRISLSDGSQVTDINSLINKVVIGVGKTNVVKEMKQVTDFVDGKIVKSSNLLNPSKMTKGAMNYVQGTSTINDILPSDTWSVSEIIDYNDVKGLDLISTTGVKCRYYKDNVLRATTATDWNSKLNLGEMTVLNLSDYDKVRFEVELYDENKTYLGESTTYQQQGFEPYGFKLVDDVSARRIKEMKQVTDFVDGKIVKSSNLLNPSKMTKGCMNYNHGTSTIDDVLESDSWYVSEIIDFDDIKGLNLVTKNTVKCRYYKNDILVDTTSGVWNSDVNLNEMSTLTDSSLFDKVRFEIELYDENTTFLIESTTYQQQGFEPYGFKLVDDVLIHRIKELEKDNRKIYLPKELYCLKGNDVVLPYRSFVSASENSFTLKSTAVDGKYKLFKDKYVKKITENDGDWFYLHDNITDKLLDSAYSTFKYADPESKSITDKKNIMILGDSFIQADVIADDFKEAMDSYNYNLNFLGLEESANGTKRMGYGGYRAWDFINNPANLRPEFPSNPFWNQITNQVDFKYFIENKMNETTLDYVILHLGVNDKLTDSLSGEDGNNEIVNRIVTLVNYIHASYPNCKIFVDGLVILSKDNEFANFRMYADDIFDYNSKLEQALSTLDNVFYVPVVATFNSDYAYEYEMVQAYKDSDEYYKVVKEWLHPSTVGYHMIADQLIPAFIYNI